MHFLVIKNNIILEFDNEYSKTELYSIKKTLSEKQLICNNTVKTKTEMKILTYECLETFKPCVLQQAPLFSTYTKLSSYKFRTHNFDFVAFLCIQLINTILQWHECINIEGCFRSGSKKCGKVRNSKYYIYIMPIFTRCTISLWCPYSVYVTF